MREISWHDLDEDPEDGNECYFCGYVKCACDEINDAYEAEMDLIYGDDD